MAIQMFKGTVSEIVSNKQVRQRLEDGWTFTPSPQKKFYSKKKITVKEVEVIKPLESISPEILDNDEEQSDGN